MTEGVGASRVVVFECLPRSCAGNDCAFCCSVSRSAESNVVEF